jgi:DNA gyrase subunit B
VTWNGGEAFAWSAAQAAQIVERHGLRVPDLAADAAALAAGAAGAPADPRGIATVRELHENRELAIIFDQLADLGIDIDDWGLTFEEAVTGERLPTKYAWITPHKASPKRPAEDAAPDAAEDADEAAAAPADRPGPSGSGGHVVPAPSVPAILESLLEVGRRGMEVKRFKGLGEMDPEQLWETTMDVSRRTLLRVTWDDASAADELFTILMGENVEQRRTYIEEHALEVKSLDV